jgi:hypothetical protein
LVTALGACDRVDFDDRVDHPAFARSSGPVVLFDVGHHNRHDIRDTYEPFARLLKNDGFRMERLAEPVTARSLQGKHILVIVNAQSQTDTNDAPAFSEAEIGAITRWVGSGGSLLLATDHYPFPNAVESLARAFGLEVAKGMVSDPTHFRSGTRDDTRLIYSRENGLLAPGPITDGRGVADRVTLVETFTGDAFKAPRPSMTLLQLSSKAIRYTGIPTVVRDGGDTRVTVTFGQPRSAEGWVQGVAFPFGSGRVVAVAEAAMLTAQEDGGRPIGMNSPGNDNRQFVLNVMRWLGRAN